MEPWLQYLLVSAALVTAAVLVVLLWRLSKAATEAERLLANLNAMRPQIERLLTEAEAELVQLRRVTEKVNRIADSAAELTRKATALATPALEIAGLVSKPLRFISAAVLGVQTAMRLFRKRSDEESEEEVQCSDDTLDPLPKPQDVEA